MKRYLYDYYDTTRNFYGGYHDQKALSAWAGLASHLLFCGAILNITPPEQCGIVAVVGYSAVTILIAYFVGLHIQNQLNLKDKGGDYVAAAKAILSEIILKDDSELVAEDYMKIEESKDLMHKSSHVLPSLLLKRASELKDSGGGAQDRTRRLLYALLVTATVLTIGEKVLWLVTLATL